MKSLFTLALAMLCFSCSTPSNDITNKEDYSTFLSIDPNPKLQEIQTEISFWETKLEATPNQSPYLSKLAAAENQWFQATGDVESLLRAAGYLELAIEKTYEKNAGLFRSLAHNFISQHRFKDAKIALLKAQKLGENKLATEKMMFDVALELGDYNLAKKQLTFIEDESDFDFLIREAKWMDTQGNLDGAIAKLQLATVKAEELKSESLKLWAYSNIADFYGHAGEIEKSYQHYLKALAIDPHQYYSLKGIAWIALSHDKKPEKAQEIVRYIASKHQALDYHLLLAEIAKVKGDTDEENRQTQKFFSKLAAQKYGDIYNKYIILENPEENTALAEKEIENRPTPQSYDLYAWSLFQSGAKVEALEVAEQYVVGKTSEPEVQYHLAEIYKANEQNEKAEMLKEELQGAIYELGPVMAQKIQKL